MDIDLHAIYSFDNGKLLLLPPVCLSACRVTNPFSFYDTKLLLPSCGCLISVFHQRPLVFDLRCVTRVATEQAPALVYPASNVRHLQVCHKSESSKNIISHLYGKFNISNDNKNEVKLKKSKMGHISEVITYFTCTFLWVVILCIFSLAIFLKLVILYPYIPS